MAGSYPDVPEYRFAYDLDGSAIVHYANTGTGLITTASSTVRSYVNRSVIGANVTQRIDIGSNSGWAVIMFPETRSISGYFISTYDTVPSGGRTLETSVDTTNGQDGTWVTRESSYVRHDGRNLESTPYYRTAINAVSWPEIKAIRFRFYAYVYTLHLYGTISQDQSPDRLRVIDLSENDISAQLDFGNVAQRASITRQFKLKNNSSSLTANNITVSLDTTSDTNPSLIGQYQVSNDNVAFANAINIGNLAPETDSATLYVRMNAAANAQLGPWTARIIAHAVSWS